MGILLIGTVRAGSYDSRVVPSKMIAKVRDHRRKSCLKNVERSVPFETISSLKHIIVLFYSVAIGSSSGTTERYTSIE